MAVSKRVAARVRADAGERCGYCRVPGEFVYAPMEIEHIIPVAAGGGDDESNLWLSCPRCNRFKNTQTHAIDPHSKRRVRLFNPRAQRWARHFELTSDGGTISGKTACGRATVDAMQLNYAPSVKLRQRLHRAGWYP